VTVRCPTLEGYLHAAAFVLDLPVETVTKMVGLDLAESALHAPQAGWAAMGSTGSLRPGMTLTGRRPTSSW
jgi:hypothetical protein